MDAFLRWRLGLELGTGTQHSRHCSPSRKSASSSRYSHTFFVIPWFGAMASSTHTFCFGLRFAAAGTDVNCVRWNHNSEYSCRRVNGAASCADNSVMSPDQVLVSAGEDGMVVLSHANGSVLGELPNSAGGSAQSQVGRQARRQADRLFMIRGKTLA